MIFAFAGNPNSGKTTLFNVLTGGSEKVGNWAGVTIEKKEGTIRKKFTGGEKVLGVDLPGAYSMSPFTTEEGVASTFIQNENVDAIINIVDATNISRSLFFTTELLECGVPVVVALNKSDLTHKKGTTIDVKKLSQLLGCPVVETVSITSKDKGVKRVIDKAKSVVGNDQPVAFKTDLPANTKEAEEARFQFVNDIVAQVEVKTIATNKVSKQDKADKILANQWLGLPIFALVMLGVFFVSQAWLGPWIAGYLNMAIDFLGGIVMGWIGGASPFVQNLVSAAIFDGVGGVIGFIPLIMVLYFMIALLEDCGYMARIAVVMDRFFKKVGLSGKSIIPIVIGVGCGIPGVMATRTIKNERQRRTTALVATFIPCGAKVPVIALLAGAFFAGNAIITWGMYIVGVAIIYFGALLVTYMNGGAVEEDFFIMELPEYKVPSIKKALISMLDRAKHFIIKAGTIILICNVVVVLMSSFTFGLKEANETASNSMLAVIASPVAWLLIPLGIGTWQLAAGAVAGFVAKENVVGTVTTVFALGAAINGDLEIIAGSEALIASTMGITAVAGLAYLVFNLFTPPCFAAIGAMNSEMGSKKWLWGAIGFQFATGYILSFLVYQIGTLIVYGTLGTAFFPGLIAVALIILAFIFVGKSNRKKAKLERV